MKTPIKILILIMTLIISGCSVEKQTSLSTASSTSIIQVLPTKTVLSESPSTLETSAPSIKNIIPTTIDTMVIEATLISKPSYEEQLIINRTISNLANKIDIPADQIQLESIEAVNWPDTSLDCKELGSVVEHQALPGYRITLSVNDLIFTYHTDTLKKMVLCSGDRPFEIYHPP